MGVEVKCIQTGSKNNGIVCDTLQVKPRVVEGVKCAGIANGGHKRDMSSQSQSDLRWIPTWSLLLDPWARGLNCQID
jgi:hypothetical protein